MRKAFPLIVFAVLTLLGVPAQAADVDEFVVSDIRVEGLQRISAGSVFTTIPVNAGDQVNSRVIAGAIRTLFRTGNFDDIRIGRDGTVLVVTVVERPSISEINIEGNKVIETDSLLDGLSGAGLSEGKVFKRSTLEGMRLELMRQYVSQGRYDAGIETEVVSLPRNRVAVNINIDEGNTAAIKAINIIGNTVYDDEDLLDEFELQSTGFWSWLSSNDKYAKEKLSGDLETLSSYYLDRGYINFNVESTQVSVTPDRKGVYITINVNEGEIFKVGEVSLSGDMVLPEEQLKPFILIKAGTTFSQAQVTNTEEWLGKRLGNEGYNFAEVEGVPDIDDNANIVNIKFFIDPGKRTYVRRITFTGNTRTADEVLRREMRQMEGAPAISSNIEQSRVRLDRLGYFKETKVDTQPVPGTDDLIDIEYAVEEQPSGSIGASVGFSQDSGVVFGASIQQDNFLGSGSSIGIGLNRSDYLTNIRFSYLNPYYTEDGVSRGFSVFYRKADLDEVNVSSYTTNTLGAAVNFGYPIKETQHLNFSLGWANTEIEVGDFAVQEIIGSPRLFEPNERGDYTQYYVSQDLDSNGFFDRVYEANEVPIVLGSAGDQSVFQQSVNDGFLDTYGNEFDNFTFTIGWRQSTLNRGRLATRGYSQSLSLETAVPGSDLEYYKLIYNGQIFFPLTKSLTLRLRTELGYGDGFGDTKQLPFFEHFFSGGFGSVRGFKSNTLGPRSTPATVYRTGVAAVDVLTASEFVDSNNDGLDDSTGLSLGAVQQGDDRISYVADINNNILQFIADSDPDPFGGNVLVEGSAELLFPLPFIKDQRSIRSAFFIDAGNVFNSDCGATQINCFDVQASELRYSFGVGISWITGFGPLTFSYAKPLNEADEDETEAFQFTLGRSF